MTFIAIAGNIGAGKTRLAHVLSEALGFDHYAEHVDPDILDRFYHQMETYAFSTQYHFVTTRYNDILKGKTSGRNFVTDRTPYEDVHVFVPLLQEGGFLNERQVQDIQTLFEHLYFSAYPSSLTLLPPDLLIFLSTTRRSLEERIRQRRRAFEAALLNPENPYLDEINTRLDAWFSSLRGVNTLAIESDTLDLVSNREDIERTVALVRDALVGDRGA